MRTWATSQATTSSKGARMVAISRRDHLVERHPLANLFLERVEQLAVAEVRDRHVQRVALGRRAIPVQDERERAWPPVSDFSQTPAPNRPAATSRRR